jgi:cobaltochelatase CobS
MTTDIFADVTTTSESLRDKLTALSKPEILQLFRDLNDGAVGFDHERVKKTECVDMLLSKYAIDQIEFALGNNHFSGTTYTAKAPKANNKAAMLAALLESMNDSPAVDEEQVQQIVDRAIADAVKRLVNRIEVVQPELPAVDVGVQHFKFETLLKACNARTPDGGRLNVWLCGPAASGKTTAARNVAKALGMSFTFNGAIATQFELLGFIDAKGICVRTPFRNAWENGGVYLFDEVDGSNPNAVTAFNAALANGVCAFPDGMVERHPDCIVIAGANTSGNGATHEYVGRMKQDKAFLDRFVEIEWPIDEKLEAAITPNEAWVKRVQGVRKRMETRGIKGHMVTPRASQYGAALLAAGIDMETVERMTLKKGLAEDAWTQIK